MPCGERARATANRGRDVGASEAERLIAKTIKTRGARLRIAAAAAAGGRTVAVSSRAGTTSLVTLVNRACSGVPL